MIPTSTRWSRVTLSISAITALLRYSWWFFIAALVLFAVASSDASNRSLNWLTTMRSTSVECISCLANLKTVRLSCSSPSNSLTAFSVALALWFAGFTPSSPLADDPDLGSYAMTTGDGHPFSAAASLL